MCYLCGPQFRNLHKFMAQARVELRTVPLSEFTAGDLPLLYLIFIDDTGFRQHVPAIQQLIHRVTKRE